MLNFFGKKKEGRELSNMYRGVVEIDEKKYSFGESAFHGQKYYIISINITDEDRKNELKTYSECFELGGEFDNLNEYEIKKKGGKKLGMELKKEEMEIWENSKLLIQQKICMYKFLNDGNVRNCLMETKDKILIHPCRVSDDKMKFMFWEGRGKMENGELVVLGGNRLGEIWMKIRDENIISM